MPTVFGEEVTADHIIARSARSQSVTGDHDALLIYDRATKWVDCYPVRTQSANDAAYRFLAFKGPKDTIKYCHTDDSRSLQNALRDLNIPHDPSTPGRPRTNGVAERQVKEVVHGTRTLLLKAGLPACFGH